MMTLDEAIKHCNEVACKHDKCSTEHKQLAQWLTELKSYRVSATQEAEKTTDNSELKELEDEKIRKEIIEYIKTGTYHKNWITWLEKQNDYIKLPDSAYTSNRDVVEFADKYSHTVWEKLMDKFKKIENYSIGCNDVSDLVLNAIINTYNWLEKQKEPEDKGEISDGYHTFNELYRYRMLYNAAFFNMLPKEIVHKSKRHHDGEECFGGGWFIVMANLPTGQISNHYELKDWDLFQVPEKYTADEWDGHTPQEAADRLYKFLSENKELFNKETLAKGFLRRISISIMNWLDANTEKGKMCLSNWECEDIENAVLNADWAKVYRHMNKKLEKQDKNKVKRWRDDSKAKITGYYMMDNKLTPFRGDNIKCNFNVFATKELAKSALAMARISQIMANDERFGGPVTDNEWNNSDLAKYTIFREGNHIERGTNFSLYRFLSFHTVYQRDLFLEENEDLIKDYYLMIKL